LYGLDLLSDATIIWWMRISDHDFWGRPVSVAKNTFAALAVSEAFRNTLFAAVKPWQAPENNYVFVAIAKSPGEMSSKKIFTYSFNDGNDNWMGVDGYETGSENLFFDKDFGHAGKGSLHIGSSTPLFPVVRWVSPTFAVKQDRIYSIEAWIFSKKVEKENRDGFMRLDFYKDAPGKFDEETLGDEVFLSERYYGEGWKKMVLRIKGLHDLGFGGVSFQVANPAGAGFWIDDVSVYESNEFYQGDADPGFVYKIPDENLIPFSGGGH
jgi:hypothetical protein